MTPENHVDGLIYDVPMLTQRQELILQLIVDDYIRTAAPISSESILRNHELDVSSATIRNDVGVLEEEGYINRPHSSAGSVPLDKAYRFYVESHIANQVDRIPPPRVRNAIRRQLSEVERDVDEWTGVSAELLAELVGNMAITTFPKAKESRVRHLQVVHLQELLLMMIVVLEQARLRKQLIRLREPVDLVELGVSINKMNLHLTGLTRRQIKRKVMDLTPLEEEMVSVTASMLREEEKAVYRDHVVDGLRNLLNQPEFAENEKMRALISGVEDGSLIQAVLDETPDGGVVRVIIGHENRGDMLHPLSVVICQYGIPNEAYGAVGAIGPTRMEYTKAIAGVRFMSEIMSDLVETVRSG